MTETSARAVVEAYHQAWTSGHIAQAMELVAEEITCRMPGGDLKGKQQYRQMISDFAPTLIRAEDIASFADGERVALFYYPQTEATQTAPAAECFTVRDGKIVESLLIFDRMSFSQSNG